MAEKLSKRSIYPRVVSIIIAFCFMVNSVSFALEGTSDARNPNSATLSPFSQFNPIVRPEDDNRAVHELASELAELDFIRDRKELSSIIYAIRLMGNAIECYGQSLLGESNGLKVIFDLHLPAIPFRAFKWRNITYDPDRDAFNVRFIDPGSGDRKDFWFVQGEKIPEDFHGMRELKNKEFGLKIYIEEGIDKDLYELIKREALNTREEMKDIGACQKHSKELARRLIKAGKDAKVIKHSDRIHYWVEVEGLVCDAFPEGLLEPYTKAARALDDERFIIEKKDNPVMKKMYPGDVDENFTLQAREYAKDEIAYLKGRQAEMSRNIRETVVGLHDEGLTEEEIEEYVSGTVFRKHLESIEADLEFLSRRAREEAVKRAIDGEDGPAIAYQLKQGRWTPVGLINIQHEIVNEAFAGLRKEYLPLPASNHMVKDVEEALKKEGIDLPVNIHSPPRQAVYDRIYDVAATLNVKFPPRDKWRLITHPGTARTEKGPRSINLFIPYNELLMLRQLKKSKPLLYREWLSHEVAHITDRFGKRKSLKNALSEVLVREKHDFTALTWWMNLPEDEKGMPSRLETMKALEWREDSSFSFLNERELEAVEELGLDMRPIERSFLNARNVGHDMAIKQVINPDDQERTAVYAGSGADWSNFILSTNATEAYFIDREEVRAYELERALIEWDTIDAGKGKGYMPGQMQEYRDKKYRQGFGVSGDKYRFMPYYIEYKIMYELKVMGVKKKRSDGTDNIKITQDPKGKTVTITFDWAYAGETEREYAITFIQAEITRPKDYPKALVNVLNNGIDIYYQRAPLAIAGKYKKFLGEIASCVYEGGYLVTDDINLEKGENDPDKILGKSGKYTFSKKGGQTSPELEKWEDILESRAKTVRRGIDSRHRIFYGWKMNIRKCLENSTIRAKKPEESTLGRGALKDLGDGGVEDLPREAEITYKRMLREGSGMFRNERVLVAGEEIWPKVVKTKLPDGMSAYHFADEHAGRQRSRAPGAELVIILDQDLPGELREEAIFHEYVEYQNRDKGPAEAHRIACAKEVLEFGGQDLTPFHKYQLEKFAKDWKKLQLLLSENREDHYKLIGTVLGEEALKEVRAYEIMFRYAVRQLLNDIDTPDSAFSATEAEFVKRLARLTKQEVGGTGACLEHAKELARRMVRAGMNAKIMKHSDHIHYWVEAGGYVCDAFPEGMPEEYTDAAKVLGDIEMIVAPGQMPVIQKLYTGKIEEELTKEAVIDASDDRAFYLKRIDRNAALLDARIKRLKYQGHTEEEINDHESVVYFRDKIREFERRADEANGSLTGEEGRTAAVTKTSEAFSEEEKKGLVKAKNKLEEMGAAQGRNDWEELYLRGEELLAILRENPAGTKLNEFFRQFRVKDLEGGINLDFPNLISGLYGATYFLEQGILTGERKEIFSADQKELKAAILEALQRIDEALKKQAASPREKRPQKERLFRDGKISARKPAIIAHRIGSLDEAEAAIAQGADMMEVDVQLTRDNILIAFWGNVAVGDEQLCVNELYYQNIADLEGKAPLRIDDLFSRVDGRLAIDLDIKDWSEEADPGYGEKVLRATADLIDKHDIAGDIYAATFNTDYMKRFKELVPGATTGISLHKRSTAGDVLEDMILEAKRIGATGIAFYVEQLSEEIIKRVHAEGLLVVVNAGDEDVPAESYEAVDLIFAEGPQLAEGQPRKEAGISIPETRDELIDAAINGYNSGRMKEYNQCVAKLEAMALAVIPVVSRGQAQDMEGGSVTYADAEKAAQEAFVKASGQGFDEGRSKVVKKAVFEAASNVSKHVVRPGQEKHSIGIVCIGINKNDAGTETLEIVVRDLGEWEGEDPVKALARSQREHITLEGYDNRGMAIQVNCAEEFILEKSGNVWVRSDQPVGLKKIEGVTGVRQGTKVTMRWDILEKDRKHRIGTLLKKLVRKDLGVDRETLNELSDMLGMPLKVEDDVLLSGVHKTVRDYKGHRHFVIDRGGNIIEEYRHYNGRFEEAVFRNIIYPEEKITLKAANGGHKYLVYIEGRKIGEVGFITLPEEIEYGFWDVNNIRISIGTDPEREESIKKSLLNIFAKWAKDAQKSLVAFNVTRPETALALTEILIDATDEDGNLVTADTVKAKQLTPEGELAEPFVFIGGRPSPIYLVKEEGQYARAKEMDFHDSAPSEEIVEAARKAEEKGLSLKTLMRLAEIKTADALIQYISVLDENVHSFDTEEELTRNRDKKYLQPLFELLFMRLVEDFKGSRRFIHSCREIMKKEGAFGLRRELNKIDSDLFRSFKNIARSRRTGKVSLQFYGVLLRKTLINSEEYFSHIYDNLIPGHKDRDVAISKKGVSYHLRGDSVIQAHDKNILFEGTSPRYKDNLKKGTFAGEETPESAKDSQEAQKIARALDAWKKLAERSDDQETKKRILGRRRRFMEDGTVVGLDMGTSLLFADPENDVVRVMHVGRGRHVLYFSRKYIESLDETDPQDISELAFWLNFGQGFLDRHEYVMNNGYTEDEKWEAIRANIAEVNNTFLADDEDKVFVDPAKMKERLAVLMKEDTIKSYGFLLGEVSRMEKHADEYIKSGERLSIENKFKHADIAREYLRCMYRYEELGLYSWAERAYRKMKWVMTAVQEFDLGILPMTYQREMVLAALRTGNFAEFLEELETLLTAKSERRKRPIYGGEIGILSLLLVEGGDAEESIRRALVTQLEAMPAGSLQGLEDIEARVEEMFRQYRENGIKNLDPDSIEEVTPPKENENVVAGLLPPEPLWGEINDGTNDPFRKETRHRKEHLFYPVSELAGMSSILYKRSDRTLKAEEVALYSDEPIDMAAVKGIVSLADSLDEQEKPRTLGEKTYLFHKAAYGLGYDQEDADYSAIITLAAERFFSDSRYRTRIKYASNGFYGRHFYLIVEDSHLKGVWLFDPSVDQFKNASRDYRDEFKRGISKTNAYWRTAETEDLDVLSETREELLPEEEAERVLERLVARIEKERLRAQEEGKQQESLVIGLDTSWIPSVEQGKIQGLISRLKDLSDKKDSSKGIKIVVEKGNALARELAALNRKEPQKYTVNNMVIIGNARVLENEAFDDLDGAFFGKLTIPVKIPEGYCINIKMMHWLAEAMRTAFTTEKRVLLFPVELVPMEKIVDKLEDRFSAQEKKIGAAA